MQEHYRPYSLLRNASDQLLLVVKCFSKPPPPLKLYYDGTSKALLKGDGFSFVLEHLIESAREALQTHNEVAVVELDGRKVTREYLAPIVEVDSLATV